jgi:hypothetical protein
MRDFSPRSALALMAVFALPLLAIGSDQASVAADHFDPPTRVDATVAANPDIPADLADLYVFQTATSLVIAEGFAGPRPSSIASTYDRDVLYTIFVSNTGDKTVPEFKIQWRVAPDKTNPAAFGVMFTGLPGVAAPLIGPAETTLTAPNGVKAMIGLFDDPFNFDAAGLTETRATGRLSIRNDRNRFTLQNTMAVVFEIPLSLVRSGTDPIAAWGTSQRIMAGVQ